jgi:glycerol-3-phosphate acyltransferase PlsY
MTPEIYWPVLAASVGYLLGSVPFAVIVARRYGVDILRAGSGNPGATNVKRVCGRLPGNVVFALDVLKGVVAAGWVWVLAQCGQVGGIGGGIGGGLGGEVLVHAQLAGFVGAVLGHCFSLFLRFKGGKGVAVSAGGLLGAMPICLAISGGIWLLVYLVSRYVSVGSLAAAVAFPVAAYYFYGGAGDPRFWLGVAVFAFLVFTHRSNIVRLVRGQEHGFNAKDGGKPQ